MKKFTPLIIAVLMIPQIAFAAWWNPFSWFSWSSWFHWDVSTTTSETAPSPTDGASATDTVNTLLLELQHTDSQHADKPDIKPHIEIRKPESSQNQNQSSVAKTVTCSSGYTYATTTGCVSNQTLTNTVVAPTSDQTAVTQILTNQNAEIQTLVAQFSQAIQIVSQVCSNADAGTAVSNCELQESKLLPILQREAVIGISVEDAQPELLALQKVYYMLQTEYYTPPSGEDLNYINGTRNNIAAEMRILEGYISMFN